MGQVPGFMHDKKFQYILGGISATGVKTEST